MKEKSQYMVNIE